MGTIPPILITNICCFLWHVGDRAAPSTHPSPTLRPPRREARCATRGTAALNTLKMLQLLMPISDVVARYIQQFYSGRLLMNEIRDHIQRWMSWGETSYGSMIEIGDEGHFAMPLDNLGVVMDQFDQDRPAWWTPQLRTRCLDTFRNMQQYYFRHSAPGGAFHRFDHTEPEGNRFLNFR